MAQLFGINFLGPEEDDSFENLYKKRVGTSLDPEDQTTPQSHLGEANVSKWHESVPFEPKGAGFESRTTEQVHPGTPGSDLGKWGVPDLTETDLREWKRRQMATPFEPTVVPPPTPLGRAAGAVSPAAGPAEWEVPGHMKKELDYSTQLSPQEERDYQKWAKANGKNPREEERDYDLKGYYKDVIAGNPNLPKDLEPIVKSERIKIGSTGKLGDHLPDTYKKPNHPTFSDESIYHLYPTDPALMPIGGHWDEKTKTFTPARGNFEHWNRSTLQHYFDKYEPGYKVNFPEWYK